MTQGIYCYVDKKDNSIVYIGKDSYIHKEMRNKGHYRKSLYNDQPINRILQNNTNKYEYKVLEEGNISQKILNALEMVFIQRYNPKFNFTKGGDGALGYEHSEEWKKWFSKNNPMKSLEQKRRMIENNPMKNPEVIKKGLETKRKNNNMPIKEKNPMFGKKHSKETKQKISKANKGKFFSDKEKQNISFSVSKTKNKSGFYRVHKEKNKKAKQGFYWIYTYPKDNKRKKIQATTIKKLKEKVKKAGLIWLEY